MTESCKMLHYINIVPEAERTASEVNSEQVQKSDLIPLQTEIGPQYGAARANLLPSVRSPPYTSKSASFFTYKTLVRPHLPKMYECNICSYNTRRRSQMGEHSLSHSEEELQKFNASCVMWQCSYCSYVDHSQAKVVGHIMYKHPTCRLLVKCYVSKEGSAESRNNGLSFQKYVWGCMCCSYISFHEMATTAHIRKKPIGKKLSVTKAPMLKQLTKGQTDLHSSFTIEVLDVLVPQDIIKYLSNDRSLASSTDGLTDEKPAKQVMPVVDMEGETAINQTMSMLMGTYAEDFGPEGLSGDLIPGDDDSLRHAVDHRIMTYDNEKFEVITIADLHTERSDYIDRGKAGPSCKICGALFKGKDGYNHAREHVTIHTGEKGWGCFYCNWKNNRRNLTIEHTLKFHSSAPRRLLRHVKADTMNDYLHEEESPESPTIVDASCKRKLLGPKSVKEAKILKMATELWECPYCKRRSKLKKTLELHMKLVHPEKHNQEQIQQCDQPIENYKEREAIVRKAVVCLVRLEDLKKYPALKGMDEKVSEGTEYDSKESDRTESPESSETPESPKPRNKVKSQKNIEIPRRSDRKRRLDKLRLALSNIRPKPGGSGMQHLKTRRVDKMWEGENEDGWDMTGVFLACKYCGRHLEDVEAAKQHFLDDHPYEKPIAKDVHRASQKQSSQVRICTYDNCVFATYLGDHYEYHLMKVHSIQPGSLTLGHKSYVYKQENSDNKSSKSTGIYEQMIIRKKSSKSTGIYKQKIIGKECSNSTGIYEQKIIGKKCSKNTLHRVESMATEIPRRQNGFLFPQRYTCGSKCGLRFETLDELKGHMIETDHGLLDHREGYMGIDLRSRMHKQRSVLFICRNAPCLFYTKYIAQLHTHSVICKYEGYLSDPSDPTCYATQAEPSTIHANITLDSVYQCSFCTSTITRLENIKSHVLTEHGISEGGFSEIASTLTAGGGLIIHVKDAEEISNVPPTLQPGPSQESSSYIQEEDELLANIPIIVIKPDDNEEEDAKRKAGDNMDEEEKDDDQNPFSSKVEETDEQYEVIENISDTTDDDIGFRDDKNDIDWIP